MPKAKSHSGAAKRFKVTGSGKIKFKHANKRHLLRGRSSRQKGELNQPGYVFIGDTARVKAMLQLKNS